MNVRRRRSSGYNRRRAAQRRARNTELYRALHKEKLSRVDREAVLRNGWAGSDTYRHLVAAVVRTCRGTGG